MCPRLPDYPARCTEPEPMEWRDDVDEEGGTECPVFIGRRFEEYFFGWQQMEKGFLPNPGGWVNQPAHWIEAFQIIGPVVAQAQRERIERMKEAQN